jgi:hypothetical protein
MTLAVFAILVAVQVPLWIVRLLGGWRLVLRGTDAARTAIASRQIQIRDILIAMTILAVFLGTWNIVAKRPDGSNGAGFLAAILARCILTMLWSALMLPICIWVCFGASKIHVRIMALIGYLVTLATIALGVTLAVSGGTVPTEAIFVLLLLHATLLATVLSGLALARACGYVLVSVRSARRQRASATASPSTPGEEAPV